MCLATVKNRRQRLERYPDICRIRIPFLDKFENRRVAKCPTGRDIEHFMTPPSLAPPLCGLFYNRSMMEAFFCGYLLIGCGRTPRRVLSGHLFACKHALPTFADYNGVWFKPSDEKRS